MKRISRNGEKMWKTRYPKETTNRWKRTTWKNMATRNPIRHKAYRIKMSLTTMKVQRAWTLDQVHDMILKPIECPYCESIIPFQNISLDHMIALSDGGMNDISNIHLVCLRCNMLKGKLNHAEFRKLLSIMKLHPELITIYEKRIEPSLKYWQRIIKRGILYNPDLKVSK